MPSISNKAAYVVLLTVDTLLAQRSGNVFGVLLCQESGRQYSRASTSAVNNLRLRDQRHVVAVDYMTFDTLTLRSDVVVRR